jgi:hypothetical protein
MAKTENPERVYLFKVINEDNEVVSEKYFFNENDARQQLELGKKDYRFTTVIELIDPNNPTPFPRHCKRLHHGYSEGKYKMF